jgi:septin family protein
MDIQFMKKLGPRANVIPVIAKADSLTVAELEQFKKRASFLLQFQKSRE